MSVAGMPKVSLRLEQAESSRLAWAFVVSLALHLALFGGYEAGKQYDWWQEAHWPAWLQPVKALAALLKKNEIPPPRPQQQETPLLFVDVSPAQAAADPPKDAKFYSDKNSRAANPQADKDTDMPKITGTQTQVVKTEDAPRQKSVPLQPSRPTQQSQEEQTEQRAKPAQAPGDLAMAKPDLTPRKDQGEAEHARPRTIKEALARQPNNSPAGQKLKQDGGVRRHLDIPSLDAKATTFGAYDAVLIEAIRDRWYTLLDQRDYASDARGKVVVRFRIHQDGRITDMDVAENTAGGVLGLICEKAVLDPAPFAPWPAEMRRMLGDTRDVQFTFYYN
jgi:outer membrane biosynthesis protein TonB